MEIDHVHCIECFDFFMEVELLVEFGFGSCLLWNFEFCMSNCSGLLWKLPLY